MKNIFWVVYDKKNNIIAISVNKIMAMEEALKKSKYRWTLQTFNTDWGYLINDGYSIKKSVIIPQ